MSLSDPLLLFPESLQCYTPRLVIRRLVPADASAMVEIYSDADAMRFRSTPLIINAENALETVALAIQPTRMRVALAERETNQLIGTLIWKRNASNRNEVGYSLGRQHWGKGLATEAMQGWIGWLRQHLATTLIARIHPDNVASIRVVQKLGFAQEGADGSYLVFVLEA